MLIASLGNLEERMQFVKLYLLLLFTALPGCAAEHGQQALSSHRTYISVEQAVSDSYQSKGNDAVTSNCLGKAMTFAIPQDERAKILSWINGGNETASAKALYDKWIVIGHEKDRPEVNETMAGYCPLQWTEFLKQGTIR